MFKSKYSWMVQKSQKMLNALCNLVFRVSLLLENLKRIKLKAIVKRMPIKN